jgi:hypothetical protein|tara:strand:+ start:2678 stop:2995 length:318 start_codon:yes stop_codon:yes gene_type:complete
MKKKRKKKLKKLWDKILVNGKEYSEIRLVVRVEHDPDVSLGQGCIGNVDRVVFIKGGKETDEFSYELHKKLADILREDIAVFMAAVQRETAGEEVAWYDKELSTV